MKKLSKIDSFNKATSVVALSIILGTISYAWTGPTDTAPNGNVPAPINVGSILQEKLGGLRILGDTYIGTSSSPFSSFTIHGKGYSEQTTDGDGDNTLVTKDYVDEKVSLVDTGTSSAKVYRGYFYYPCGGGYNYGIGVGIFKQTSGTYSGYNVGTFSGVYYDSVYSNWTNYCHGIDNGWAALSEVN